MLGSWWLVCELVVLSFVGNAFCAPSFIIHPYSFIYLFLSWLERTKKYEILNRPDQSTPREEVDSPPTNHAELDRPSYNFREQLLSKPTSFICHEFYDDICTALDQNHPLGNDYNLLGEHIGLKKSKVDVLSQKGNPTKSMMQTLDSQKDGTIMRFQEIMEKMDRHDVLRIIENWIENEWKDPHRRNKLVF